MEALIRDIRLALRVLGKTPAFTALSIATIALGIGASTAVFSMVNAVFVRPLPFTTQGTLIRILQPSVTSPDAMLSTPEIEDYRTRVPEIATLAEYHSMAFEYYGRGDPRRVQTGVVSDSFFDMIGVQPLLGRTFRPGEEAVGAPPVVLVSYKYWKNELGADPDIVGQTFTMNDRIHTIVGVLPPLPAYPNDNDIWMPAGACPFRSAPQMLNSRSGRMLRAYAVLEPGATVEQATRSIQRVSARLHEDYPADYPEVSKLRMETATVRDETTAQARPLLYTLLAMGVFVLVIATANFANLVLLRQMARRRETALRTALGASGGRLFRAIATESLCVTLLGGALGVGIAHAALDLLRSLAMRVTPRGEQIAIDPTVLAFAVSASIAVGLAAALLPLRGRRANLNDALRQAGTNATPGRAESRIRGTLVLVQVAFACIVLVGAGLVTRSLLNLEAVAGGFDMRNVMTARVDLNWTTYTNNAQVLDFGDRLLERLRASPGVIAASLSSNFPLNAGAPRSLMFRIRGEDASPERLEQQRSNATIASDGYFEAAGIPILRGRGFDAADRDRSNRVVVVSARLARTFFNGDPLGRQISWDGGTNWATIVGIAGDVRMNGLSEDVNDQIYGPFAMFPVSDIRVLVRVQGYGSFAGRLVPDLVREIDDKQPVTSIQTLEQLRGGHLVAPRVTTVLLVAFGLLALAITLAGLIGVVGQSVAQRTTEIGIRVALGARAPQVLWSVLRNVMLVIVTGIGMGLVGALFATRLIGSLLYAVAPLDALTYASVGIVLLALALLACFVAARQALAVEPIEALRSD
jgi:putative ABC transport system permease protein